MENLESLTDEVLERGIMNCDWMIRAGVSALKAIELVLIMNAYISVLQRRRGYVALNEDYNLYNPLLEWTYESE